MQQFTSCRWATVGVGSPPFPQTGRRESGEQCSVSPLKAGLGRLIQGRMAFGRLQRLKGLQAGVQQAAGPSQCRNSETYIQSAVVPGSFVIFRLICALYSSLVLIPETTGGSGRFVWLWPAELHVFMTIS